MSQSEPVRNGFVYKWRTFEGNLEICKMLHSSRASLAYLQATELSLTMIRQGYFLIRFSKRIMNFLWVENFRFQRGQNSFAFPFMPCFLIKITLAEILNNFVTLYTHQKVRKRHGLVSDIGLTGCQLLPRYINNFSFN